MSLAFLKSKGRLLRERWATPEALAHELYAMFSSKGESEIQDTLTIRVPEGKPALRIERDTSAPSTTEIKLGGTSRAADPAPIAPAPRPQRPDADPRRRVAGIIPQEENVRAGRDRSAPLSYPEPPKPKRPSAPLVEINGGVRFGGREPIEFTQMPVFVNPKTGQAVEFATAPQLEDLKPDFGNGGGSSVYFGVVVDGSGDTYNVTLYPKGPKGEPGKTVTVQIPQIDPTDRIDKGTWLEGIQSLGGTYWCQPPVWGV